jgi:DNA modification methylase
MAKKDQNTQELFTKAVPKMPEGYYSGDKPNTNLRAFVEQHLRENPYDPTKDKYDVLAFNKPIEGTKATAIYNMHTYWSKKPHDAVRQYIVHYTKPRDLVLDPFCGSGSTALAALMEGRMAIAIDRSPAATFITKNDCTPVDVVALRAAFEELKTKVKPELDWLCQTRCDRCGGNATTGYTVYSQVFQCPRCMQKVALFDCVEADGQTNAAKPKKVNVCPHCHERGLEEIIRSQSEKFGAVPVQVSYLCVSGCKPQRGERLHNDPDQKRRDFFQKHDLAKIREIEAKDIPHWYPKGFSMTGFSRYQRDALRLYGVAEAADLFFKRNLWALAAIRSAVLASSADQTVKDTLLFGLNAVSLNCSRLYQYRPSLKGGFAKGTYYVPQDSQIINVWRAFSDKIADLASAAFDTRCRDVFISTQSSTRIDQVLSDSIDFIFTDPPYADKVQYGELNFVWEAWLGFDTHWHDEEIIVNAVRGKSETDWANMMRQAMRECFRVLKPGRWLSLCYHDTSEGTWSLVQDVMADAGFVVDTGDGALFIDTGQKSYNQLTADKVTKRDLVINFRKPKPGERGSKVHFTGEENQQTFREKAQTVMREFLQTNPGATKDRIYDEVVSRLVRKGQMEAHNFEELLHQVADEVKQPAKKTLFENEEPDLLGSHEVGRWYLKESEAGGEEAEQATANAAGAKLHEFLAKTTAQKLKDSEAALHDLEAELARKRKALQAVDEDKSDESRPRLVREIRELTEKMEKLKAERAEWQQQALHYSEIMEFYLYVQPKPRSTLEELLEDYCYQTDEGKWRPPLTDDEKKEKSGERQRAVRRQIQRLFNVLESGGTIPAEVRPDDATLAEWIRHCKRTGLYAQGKLLYERAGLNLDKLSEEDQVNVEEDYQVCARGLTQPNASTRPSSKQGSMNL